MQIEPQWLSLSEETNALDYLEKAHLLQDDLEALRKLRARATHSSAKRLGRRDYEHFKTILFGAEGDRAGLLGIVQALQDRMGS